VTETLPPAARALDVLGIPYRVFVHEKPIRSLEQAARERGQRIEQVVRSILFRIAPEEYVLVLAPGGKRVSWPRLRHYLGRSRITMATPEEVLQVTGYPIGAVSPFGLAQSVPILADERIFAPEEVSLGSGERGVAIILRRDDLRRALADAKIGDWVEQGIVPPP